MFFNWRGIAIVLVVLLAVIALMALDLKCSGSPEPSSDLVRIKGEMAAGRKEARYQQAEQLAALARDFRALASHYKAQGETRKAQRAVAAAQELDRKIQKLLED